MIWNGFARKIHVTPRAAAKRLSAELARAGSVAALAREMGCNKRQIYRWAEALRKRGHDVLDARTDGRRQPAWSSDSAVNCHYSRGPATKIVTGGNSGKTAAK